MANNLTAITADAFKAAEIIGREAVGAISSVLVNAGSEAVAKGEYIKSATTPEPTLNSSVTPAMTIPEGDDRTYAEKSFQVNQIANVTINVTGEERLKVNTRHNYETVHGADLERASRKIRNQIESYLCTQIYKGASRAVGTAGTTPFASNLNVIPQLRQVIFDNGFWVDGEMSLIINSAAGVNMRNLTQLQKVNEAGGSDTLRRGELLNLSGFSIKESAGIATHTAGNGTGYQLSAAEAIGSTVINLDTGSGTIIAGDVLSFTGSTDYKYVVGTALASGSATINDPGIMVAVADNTACGNVTGYTANLGVRMDCVELVARPLAAPPADAASDVIQVPDPITGLVYEIREYGGFHKQMWSISVVYDAKVWNSQGVAILQG